MAAGGRRRQGVVVVSLPVLDEYKNPRVLISCCLSDLVPLSHSPRPPTIVQRTRSRGRPGVARDAIKSGDTGRTKSCQDRVPRTARVMAAGCLAREERQACPWLCAGSSCCRRREGCSCHRCSAHRYGSSVRRVLFNQLAVQT